MFVEETNTYKMLERINDASDVRALPRSELPQLCQEVRACIIDTVSKTSGHLASGLGVVELTVALHYVYDTPHDILVWDVGHQAYPHKILTGHRKEFATIRQYNGLHAFIWRNETPYDLITTGHASTSIGSALGLAVAERNKPKEQRRKVVAIIGDGALSGGCAFEALNHAGSFKDIDLTVILNDNEMSISENVGSIAQGLSHVISSPHYVKLVEGGKRILHSLPAVKDFAMRAQEHVKGMIMPGTMFEEFGFNYIGPVDGHDVTRLESILANIKEMSGLTFLHVVTKKGKGYEPAERDPICYHGVPAFNPEEGICKNGSSEDKSYSAAFGRWMCDKAHTDRKLMAVTPAMRIGSGLAKFAELYPNQFFDVAIAEQHAMVFASGLAAGGMRPVVNIYSTFMQRAYDGLIHDMAIQNLPMILCLDRGGVVGSDGPTHNGAFDIAYTRTVPNLVIMAPSSRHDLYYMLNTAYEYGKPVVIRYPRATGESLMVGQGNDARPMRLSLEKRFKIGQAKAIALSSFEKEQVLAKLADLGLTPVRSSEQSPEQSSTSKENIIAQFELYELDQQLLAAPEITEASSAATAVAPAADSADATAPATAAIAAASPEATAATASAAQAVESAAVVPQADALGKRHKVALLGYGPMALALKDFALEQDLSLFDMRFIKPVDEALISYLNQNYDLLVTIEEGAKLGGIGEHIASLASSEQCAHHAKVLNIGLPDRFIMEGERNQLLKVLGLDNESLKNTIIDAICAC